MKQCSKCQKIKKLTEFSLRKDREGKYLSACKECRATYYKNKRPPNTRLVHNCKADSLRWHAEKRQARTKQARLISEEEWDFFFFQEIHDLRRKRNKLTKIEWHVDHIIPLHNKQVCGLHCWTNMRLIPAYVNRRKSNAFYEKWEARL